MVSLKNNGVLGLKAIGQERLFFGGGKYAGRSENKSVIPNQQGHHLGFIFRGYPAPYRY